MRSQCIATLMCSVFLFIASPTRAQGELLSVAAGAGIGVGCEKLLYHAPLLLSFPGVALAYFAKLFLVQAISADNADDKNQRNANLAALTGAAACYLLENRAQSKEAEENIEQSQ